MKEIIVIILFQYKFIIEKNLWIYLIFHFQILYIIIHIKSWEIN